MMSAIASVAAGFQIAASPIEVGNAALACACRCGESAVEPERSVRGDCRARVPIPEHTIVCYIRFANRIR